TRRRRRQPQLRSSRHVVRSRSGRCEPLEAFSFQLSAISQNAELLAESRQLIAESDMPTIVQAAFLGVIQGLTEFLPVSSTAHLLIAERLLGFQDPGGVFTVMIQLGSILAVMWLYREKIRQVIVGLPSSPEARRFAMMVALATVPALVAGGLFSKFVKGVLYGNFVV